LDGAERNFRKALEIAQKTSSRDTEFDSVSGLAELALAAGKDEEFAAHIGRLRHLATEMHEPIRMAAVSVMAGRARSSAATGTRRKPSSRRPNQR